MWGLFILLMGVNGDISYYMVPYIDQKNCIMAMNEFKQRTITIEGERLAVVKHSCVALEEEHV